MRAVAEQQLSRWCAVGTSESQLWRGDKEREKESVRACVCVCFVYLFARVITSGVTRITRLRRQDGGQHGYGTVDPDREQAAGCVHAARRAYAARSAADRGGGRPERGQELRA